MQLPDLGAWGLWGLFIGTFLAATIVPFSADVLYITVLQMTSSPWACLVVAALGNWLGNLTTYGLGRLGKWDWIEKHTKVTRAQLEKQKVYPLHWASTRPIPGSLPSFFWWAERFGFLFGTSCWGLISVRNK